MESMVSLLIMGLLNALVFSVLMKSIADPSDCCHRWCNRVGRCSRFYIRSNRMRSCHVAGSLCHKAGNGAPCRWERMRRLLLLFSCVLALLVIVSLSQTYAWCGSYIPSWPVRQQVVLSWWRVRFGRKGHCKPPDAPTASTRRGRCEPRRCLARSGAASSPTTRSARRFSAVRRELW